MYRLALLVILVGCGSSPARPRVTASEPASCGAPLPPGARATAHQIIQTTHAGAVTELAFSADGYLATTSQFDKTIRIWDLKQRALLAVLQGRNDFYWDDAAHALVIIDAGEGDADPILGETMDLLVGPDGRTLGSRRGTPPPRLVHDGVAIRGELVRRLGKPTYLEGKGRMVTLDVGTSTGLPDRASIVHEGKQLAGVLGSELGWWSLDDGRRVASRALDGELADLAFTAAGDAVAAFERDDDDGPLVVVYPRDPSAAARPVVEPREDEDNLHVAVARDGSLAVVSSPGALVGYDVATGKPVWREEGDVFRDDRDVGPVSGFWDVRLAPDGATLVVPRYDGSLALRDLRTGRDLGGLGAAVDRPEDLAWIDDTHLLAATAGHVAVWDVPRAAIAASYTEPSGFLSAGVIDGDVVVARMTNCFGPGIDDAHTIGWVDRWSGFTPPPALLAGTQPALRSACDTAAGVAWPPPRGLATAALRLGGAGQGLDVRTGSSLGHTQQKFLAPFDAVRLADGALVKQAFVFKASQASDVVLRGDHVIAELGMNKGVGVWRVHDGTYLHALTATRKDWQGQPQPGGELLGISPDGARVAVANGWSIAIFETATGRALATATLSDNPTAIAFGAAPAEAWIGTWKGRLYHWNGAAPTDLGAQAATWIARLAVSPDGRRIVALGNDGGLRVLDARGQLAATLVEFADEEPIAFTPGGAYAGSAEAAERVAWRFDAPVEVFRFEQFAHAFHAPDVVRARLAGGRADIAAGLERPPTIALTAAPANATAATARLELRVGSSRRVDVVRAYREGREVAAAPVCKPTGTVALDVPLLAGTNTIAVQAFDDGGYASNPAIAHVARAGGAHPELYVVAVGIGRYPALGPELQLPVATADATGLAAAFRRYAGPGKRFAALHDRVLLDDAATVPAILAALDGLAAMKPDDLAIVSFAGHGVKPTEADDMVLATGAVRDLAPAALRAASVGWPAIAERLARAKGRVIVLLDACHSGHVSQNLVVPNDRLAALLARERRAGVIVFAASKGRQSSYEPTGTRALVRTGGGARVEPAKEVGTGHGFFTGALLAALGDPRSDRDGDGVLQMSEWIAATRARVHRATEGKQTPWVARQEMFGDFAIVPVR